MSDTDYPADQPLPENSSPVAKVDPLDCIMDGSKVIRAVCAMMAPDPASQILKALVNINNGVVAMQKEHMAELASVSRGGGE